MEIATGTTQQHWIDAARLIEQFQRRLTASLNGGVQGLNPQLGDRWTVRRVTPETGKTLAGSIPTVVHRGRVLSVQSLEMPHPDYPDTRNMQTGPWVQVLYPQGDCWYFLPAMLERAQSALVSNDRLPLELDMSRRSSGALDWCWSTPVGPVVAGLDKPDDGYVIDRGSMETPWAPRDRNLMNALLLAMRTMDDEGPAVDSESRAMLDELWRNRALDGMAGLDLVQRAAGPTLLEPGVSAASGWELKRYIGPEVNVGKHQVTAGWLGYHPASERFLLPTVEGYRRVKVSASEVLQVTKLLQKRGRLVVDKPVVAHPGLPQLGDTVAILSDTITPMAPLQGKVIASAQRRVQVRFDEFDALIDWTALQAALVAQRDCIRAGDKFWGIDGSALCDVVPVRICFEWKDTTTLVPATELVQASTLAWDDFENPPDPKRFKYEAPKAGSSYKWFEGRLAEEVTNGQGLPLPKGPVLVASPKGSSMMIVMAPVRDAEGIRWHSGRIAADDARLGMVKLRCGSLKPASEKATEQVDAEWKAVLYPASKRPKAPEKLPPMHYVDKDLPAGYKPFPPPYEIPPFNWRGV